MASRTVVIHVGTHKTGTTSFQSLIAGNEAHFVDRGVYYPRSGRVRFGHHNLAWELAGDARHKPGGGTIADLEQELVRQHPTGVLISSEDFEFLYRRPEQLARLRATMERCGLSARVVVVLREPSDYLESLYSQLVKKGLAEDIGTFASGALHNGGVLFRGRDYRLDYRALVNGFGSAFGRHAVRVVGYDPSDAVAPLLAACGEELGGTLPAVPGWDPLNVRSRAGTQEALQRNLAAAGDGRPGRNRAAASPDPAALRVALTVSERNAISAAFGAQLQELTSRGGHLS